MDFLAKICRGIGEHFRLDPDTAPEIRGFISINGAWQINIYFLSFCLLENDITLSYKCKIDS